MAGIFERRRGFRRFGDSRRHNDGQGNSGGQVDFGDDAALTPRTGEWKVTAIASTPSLRLDDPW